MDLFSEVDINYQNKNGDTALHLCSKDKPDLAKYLVLKFRADHTIKNNIGDSPLEIAKRSQSHDLVMAFN